MTIVVFIEQNEELVQVKVIPTDTSSVPKLITVGCEGSLDDSLQSYTCAYFSDGRIACLNELQKRILSGEELTIYINSEGDADWASHLVAKTRLKFVVSPFEE